MDIEYTKHLLLKRATLLMGLMLALVLFIRPLLITMDSVFTIIGIVNFTLFSLFYFYLVRTTRKSWHSFIIFALFLITLMPLFLISGGVNSQFVIMIPLVPLFLCLIGDARIGQLGAVSFIVIIILMTWFNSSLLDLTSDTNTIEKTYSRAFWLCLACGWSAYFGTVFDSITSKLTKKLEQQALFDDLTKVANRGSILSYLNFEIARQQQNAGWISVLMLDIDYFKAINDRFGHLAGDQCLKEVASTIKGCLPNEIDKVGRYGGEEFLIVLGDSAPAQSQVIAENIRTAIANLNVTINNENVSVTVTIGYSSLCSPTTDDAEQLIKSADNALYSGKKMGRNQVVDFDQIHKPH